MTSSQNILITGATSGIGAATARALLASGHRVAVTGRSAEKLDAFIASVDEPSSVLGIVSDASDFDSTRDAVEQTVAHFGSLDAAVANAGYAFAGDDTASATIGETGKPEEWPAMVLTNVLGPAYLAQAALPHLQASGGRLVLLGSVAGTKNSPGNLYSAAKWGVVGLAENLRLLATNVGVGVTLINPGMIDTPFWRGKAAPFALAPEPIAEAIRYALEQPNGVDVNTITVRPVGQPV